MSRVNANWRNWLINNKTLGRFFGLAYRWLVLSKGTNPAIVLNGGQTHIRKWAESGTTLGTCSRPRSRLSFALGVQPWLSPKPPKVRLASPGVGKTGSPAERSCRLAGIAKSIDGSELTLYASTEGGGDVRFVDAIRSAAKLDGR